MSKSSQVRQRWYRDWLACLLIGSMLYGIVCTYGLATDVGRPFPGFITYINPITATIGIDWNVPSWWWIGTDDHPALNDELLEVDGVPFRQLSGYIDNATIYANAHAEGREYVPAIVIHPDGSQETLHLSIQPFLWTHFGDILTSPIIIALSLWVLAFILYRAAAAQQTQRIAAGALLFVGISVIGSRPSLFHSDAVYIVPMIIQSVAFTFAGALFLHLTADFPFQRTTKGWQLTRKLYLTAVYTIATISGLAYVLSRLIIEQQGFISIAGKLDEFWLKNSSYLVAAAALVFLTRLILEAAFTAKEPRHKREAIIILVSIIIALPAIWLPAHRGFGNADLLLFMQSLADPRYFFLAMPFAFSAITLRYHTFDGAENWMLFVLLVAISGLVANLSMIVLFSRAPQLVHQLSIPVQPVLFFIFFGLSFFWSRQNDWNGWLGRIFQWERINYGVVRQFGEAVADVSYENTAQLSEHIVTILCQELDLECAAVWMDDGQDEQKLELTAVLKLTAVSGTWHTPAPDTMHTSANNVTPQRLQNNRADWLSATLPANAAVALPLKSANQLFGAMIVGKRWDSAVFDERDLEMLSLIAQQATGLLRNAQQLEALRAADKQMLQIQTNTQQKIARDLHDFILPALGRFPMQIEASLNYLDADQEKSKQILHESVRQLGETAVQLRRIQQDLVIRPMEYGLSPHLLDLAERFTTDTDIPITLTLPPETDTVIADTPTREIVYAVWQQALDNTVAHAQATRVTINLTLADDIYFSITDDGIGATEAQQVTAAANGRFGLKSMQMRLESANGRFRFSSQPGKGSTVEGWLPLP